tara:strand:+ start:157 stop:1704 length:1548 start_codon:yes stop_codon:yes gene_type:complete
MKKKAVRVRFAPSPTGPLHIGGVRTALYNYLFARKEGGDFILRIEDTDQSRYVEGAEQYILDSLDWCGLSVDEGPINGGPHGPYRQSERKGIYQKYAQELLDSGRAYYAFDTEKELEEMRNSLKQAGHPSPQYNNITRSNMKNSLSLSKEEVQKRLKRGDSYVVRINIPRNETIKFEDQIRGWVSFNTNFLDDKVLFKSDGMPTYHLANVVDDYLMKISHVIRGEEWLPSAPLHVLLYKFLGIEEAMPRFCHLPLILNPEGKGKLSKRDGDRLGFPVFPMEWTNPENGGLVSGYKESGFLPEAFINMLVFLGWNPGTSQELFSKDQLIKEFSFHRVNKSGARYNFQKMLWFNQQHLRDKKSSWLLQSIYPEIKKKKITHNEEYLLRAIDIIKERITFKEEILKEGDYLFFSPDSYDEKITHKKWKPDSAEHLQGLIDKIQSLDVFSAKSLENAFQDYLASKGLAFGRVMPALRLAVTGRGAGPSMFLIMELLGIDEVLKRINKSFKKLGDGKDCG